MNEISKNLLGELTVLIEQSQQQAVIYINSTLTSLFWQIGNKINQDILKNKRADYSKQIVSTLSTQLSNIYGKNYELRNLRRMMQFSEQFRDFEVLIPLTQQLSCSHFVELLPLKTFDAKLLV